MNAEQRIELLQKLGDYIRENSAQWVDIKARAGIANAWFIPQFTDRATFSIASNYLDAFKLSQFATQYSVRDDTSSTTVGLILAGNIPLVGFHDVLCVFLSGHQSLVKTSTKDEILLKHLVGKMNEWEPEISTIIRFSDQLKSCHAYIATGSNNSSKYFDYYFNKYPHIIRRNRTSVAVLDGTESAEDLANLSDAVNLYFGLGCRNVTKMYVPPGYDFIPLLESFNKYAYFVDHNKYRNNFDYQYAILLIDHKYYMTNGSVLLAENEQIFSPISQLNYGFYTDRDQLITELSQRQDVQCLTGNGLTPFATIQDPTLTDFADNVDTMSFLAGLK
ncbi:MAG: acyl-CoA reductase [Chitinophagaceae bacterium]